MAKTLRAISPVDGSLYVERPCFAATEIEETLAKAQKATHTWQQTPLPERIALLTQFVDQAVQDEDAIAEELTMQMGRPISDGKGECNGFKQRGHRMLELATDALADQILPDKDGFTRYIRREPLGIVLALAPWNYPWLTAVNVIVPALASGNVVLLKHAEQTPLVAERLSAAAKKVGLAEGVFQHMHIDHEQTAHVIGDPRIAYVCFTGSVVGGRAVQSAAAQTFAGVSLELGGKDPAYVRADADIAHAASNLVEGAFFNAGQSCCAVERIYVQQSIHDKFVDAFVTEAKKLKLGDPRNPSTTLGPVVRSRNAELIRNQTEAAIKQGARSVMENSADNFEPLGPAYLAPDVLIGVTQSMALMREETFGPVVGIASVKSDEQAIEWMNDSAFGLTASIWTPDIERAQTIGASIDTGTVYCNRCDYLDPDLPWVGVKDSGRGCSLSTLGYQQLTRPKSFHLRH